MNVIDPNLVKTNFQAANKEDCLRKIAQDYKRAEIITDADFFYHKLMEREKTLSTGIGYGIAIPHLRDESVRQLTIGIYLLDREIEFNSIDLKKVRLIVCFAIPSDSGNRYMKVLQKVSEFFRSESNRESTFRCEDKETLLKIFRRLTNEL
jgi:fructose-specific phosphotransferase system IIA component